MKPCFDPHQEEALQLFLDGELLAADQTPLFSHLAACPACRRQLEAALTFRRMSRQEHIALPPSADESFLQRLEEHRRSAAERPARWAAARRPSLHRSRRVPLPAAAAAALTLFVLGIVLPGPAEAPATPAVPALVMPAETTAPRTADETEVRRASSAFPRPDSMLRPVYVFYPGLTVEGQRYQPVADEAR